MKREESSTSNSNEPPKKKARAVLACLTCRRKRIKCSGEQPICAGCATHKRACEWDLETDKRKPFTREVVEALQQQIVSLEAKLAATASGSIESADADPVPAATQEQAASETTEGQPSAETIEGGLSTNRHGEIRYFGPLSSMSVLADAAASAEGLQAARYAALTQACEPFNAIDYQPPPKPPPLSQELQGRLLRYAFEYALPAFCLVDERRFYADMAADKMSRTHNYSPLLLNVILGMGARYLEPNEDFPRAICTDPNDTDTRGEVFIDFARSVIDHEWKLPRISTLRALACLSLWMVGKRGYDGVSWLHIGMATRVAENFGLHLGIHHLSASSDLTLDNDAITTRREAFYALFGHETFMSLHIGRNGGTFRADEFDQQPPVIDVIVDFDQPMYRSSALQWASKLALITAKVLGAVYAKRGLSLAARRKEVPSLHLELQTWYHALPSHVKVSAADATKKPHSHVICVNMLYWLTLLHLHRPFFSRISAQGQQQPSSTEKCLLAASHIVRLVKIQQKSLGFRLVHPWFVHATFGAGVILAMSASQMGISSSAEQDQQRQKQSRKDLVVIIEALKEVGRTTWSSATASAETLQALMSPAANGFTSGDRSRVITRQHTPELKDEASVPLPPFDHSSLNMLLNMPNVNEVGQPDVTLQGVPQQPAFLYFSEQMFPSWDWNGTGADFDFTMNQLSTSPYAAIPDGNLLW